MLHSSQDSVIRPNPRVTIELVENTVQSGSKLGNSLKIQEILEIPLVN